jgi:hypothetical protein
MEVFEEEKEEKEGVAARANRTDSATSARSHGRASKLESQEAEPVFKPPKVPA